MFPLRFNFPFIKSDGSRTTIGDAISAGGGGSYTLPTASADTKGGVKIGSGLSMDGEVLSATGGGSYTLPTASSETKGGIKIGSGLSMDGEVLNNSNPTPYSLPTASANTLGGVKVGSGLSITDGVLSATGGGSSFTPDYTNDKLIIGTHGDYEYYVPMSKIYIGQYVAGYRFKTINTSDFGASIEVYSILYDDGIQESMLLKTLVFNGDSTYQDDNISVSYSNMNWNVAFATTYYNTSGIAYNSPLSWSYDSTHDYIALSEIV